MRAAAGEERQGKSGRGAAPGSAETPLKRRGEAVEGREAPLERQGDGRAGGHRPSTGKVNPGERGEGWRRTSISLRWT